MAVEIVASASRTGKPAEAPPLALETVPKMGQKSRRNVGRRIRTRQAVKIRERQVEPSGKQSRRAARLPSTRCRVCPPEANDGRGQRRFQTIDF